MIDWERVAELRAELGADDFDEVADLFVEEVSGAIAEIDAVAGDPAALAEHLHALKGAAANLGFADLFAACQTAEKAAAAGQAHTTCRAALRAIFDASSEVFAARLDALRVD